jgi:hypothetical protein
LKKKACWNFSNEKDIFKEKPNFFKKLYQIFINNSVLLLYFFCLPLLLSVASASPIQIYKNPIKLLNYDKLSPESTYQLVMGDFKVCPEIRNMNFKNICEIPKVTNVIKRQVDFNKLFLNQRVYVLFQRE